MSDRVLYLDSSALVKLVVDEPQSVALTQELTDEPTVVSSALARVEVPRAIRIQTRGDADAEARARELVDSCRLVELRDPVLDDAAALASADLRTLDAIHLASALQVAPAAMVTYDRRLAEAAMAARLPVLAPA